MELFKEKLGDLINELNQEWVKSVQKGQTEEGLDMTVMFGKFSEISKKFDMEFNQFKQRVDPKGKRGFF